MNLVILTGAGISKSSGIQTYRDVDGLWTKINENQGTIEVFKQNLEAGQHSSNQRRWAYQRAQPNDGHLAVAELQAEWQQQERGNFTVVTQNIDSLHEKAGSGGVIHMHGEISKVRHWENGDVHE